MAVSTAPAAKKYLYDGLRARPALQSVQVTWDQPVDHVEREVIVIGGIRQTQDWGPFGHKKKEEDYLIEITIVVERSFGDDRQAMDDRSFTLMEEIATYLRSDPSLGNLITHQAQIVDYEQTPLANSAEDWSQSAITAHVRCVTYI